MKSVGPFILPIKTVEVVHSLEDIMDIVMDLKIPDMPKALRMMLNSRTPMILAMTKDDLQVVGILCYQPIDDWKSNPAQDMILFVGPSASKLIEYFARWQRQTTDPFQQGAIATIITYLRKLIEAQKKRQQYYYNINSGSASTTAGW
jgi:hypothetical protein